MVGTVEDEFVPLGEEEQQTEAAEAALQDSSNGKYTVKLR